MEFQYQFTGLLTHQKISLILDPFMTFSFLWPEGEFLNEFLFNNPSLFSNVERDKKADLN